jgi:hypothetical protein
MQISLFLYPFLSYVKLLASILSINKVYAHTFAYTFYIHSDYHLYLYALIGLFTSFL